MRLDVVDRAAAVVEESTDGLDRTLAYELRDELDVGRDSGYPSAHSRKSQTNIPAHQVISLA